MPAVKLRYTTRDIVTIVVLSVIFGIVGAGWGYVWNLAFAIPVAGGIISAAISFVWFIGPLVTFYLLRKPGVAAVTQLLTGVVAILAGHPAGLVVYGWYLLEAAGAELGFAILRYRRRDLAALCLAGTLQAINYAWGLVYFQIHQFGFSAWFWPWIFTFLTAGVAGPIALAIGRSLDRTGLYASAEDASRT